MLTIGAQQFWPMNSRGPREYAGSVPRPKFLCGPLEGRKIALPLFAIHVKTIHQSSRMLTKDEI